MPTREIQRLTHEFLPLQVKLKHHRSAGLFSVSAFVDSSFAEEVEELNDEAFARHQARVMHARWVRILETVYAYGFRDGRLSIPVDIQI